MAICIGEKIRAARIAQGLTQEDLAEKSGITVRSIQRIENNSVSARASNIKKIEESLGFSAGELIGDAKPNPASRNKLWLMALHASSFVPCILPTLCIVAYKYKDVKDIKTHSIDILNFQINIIIVFFVLGMSAFLLITVPVLVFVSLSVYFIITLNTIRVAFGMPYRYPLIYAFIKPTFSR